MKSYSLFRPNLAAVVLGAAALSLVTSALFAADPPLGGMKLLPGYKHQPLQGIDSIVGEIKKEGGLRIMYEIGAVIKPGAPRFGGSFTDRPKQTPKDQARWYDERVVGGQPMHVAYRKDNLLLVSFPQKGMNLSATVRTADEMAEVLLMIMTYPEPVPAKEAPQAK